MSRHQILRHCVQRLGARLKNDAQCIDNISVNVLDRRGEAQIAVTL
jgi:hypothetical protein